MASDASSRRNGHQSGGRSALEIARRHEEAAGRPLSPVMKTAATACELAYGTAVHKRGGTGC